VPVSPGRRVRFSATFVGCAHGATRAPPSFRRGSCISWVGLPFGSRERTRGLRYNSWVLPVQNIASDVLAGIIRRQPPSRERTSFAWSIVAGPALTQAATVDLRDGILYVTPKDDRWTRELHRAGDTLLTRLQALLGPDLRELRVVPAPRSSNLQSR